MADEARIAQEQVRGRRVQEWRHVSRDADGLLRLRRAAGGRAGGRCDGRLGCLRHARSRHVHLRQQGARWRHVDSGERDFAYGARPVRLPRVRRGQPKRAGQLLFVSDGTGAAPVCLQSQTARRQGQRDSGEGTVRDEQRRAPVPVSGLCAPRRGGQQNGGADKGLRQRRRARAGGGVRFRITADPTTRYRFEGVASRRKIAVVTADHVRRDGLASAGRGDGTQRDPSLAAVGPQVPPRTVKQRGDHRGRGDSGCSTRRRDVALPAVLPGPRRQHPPRRRVRESGSQPLGSAASRRRVTCGVAGQG